MDVDKLDVTESGVLTASPQRWGQAESRFAVLAPLLETHPVGLSVVDDAAERLGLSRRQVYVLLDKLENGTGTVADLLVRRPSGGRGRSRVADAVEEIIAEQVGRHFLRRQKLSVAAVHRRIAVVCHRAGLPPPSRNTVAARIAALNPAAVARARGGADAARPRQAAGDIPPPIRGILELVQVDHTVVDVMVVDEYERRPIGRPYLTVAIDVFSRAILGFVVTLEPPSAVSVGLCLGRVCSEKQTWLQAHDLAAEVRWPMAGKPERLYLDNAAEFKSEALRRGCAQHAITLNYRPPGRPHYGGIVERVIGTAMTAVHELPGTTFSNPSQRGSYDSDVHAALTLRELERWLVLSIATYHESVHTGLRQSPAAKWGTGVDAATSPPRVVVDETAFLIDFLPVIRRRLTRTGFVIDHVRYFSNALKPWVARRERLGAFVIRRDPRDLSRIWVLEPDGAGYIEVPYRMMAHPAVTLWEHRAATARLREQGRSSIDESALFSMIEQMRDLTDRAQKDTRRARRNRQRRNHLADRTSTTTAMSAPPHQSEPDTDVSVFDDIEQW
ncbi:DDE-type integrase/transposase/recombinase [Rhodococcus sp. BP-349]|uniref:Mu transposase C-terminal domain-containing protein n=1 Tax=unclassified Rhodococcus (in: high G+C Gram-positive bacteria) TaxID=192944 RepID=UPI001D625FDA|nr:DDE-type integrase/transposase/recombinase [Rhodococcus sp. BP-363]MBY6541930.1 DDE-type integrase/transposase/recombinase [Rhodococcus sp. BP-369]MBY6561160.1 DDE-type integrase/transposase/recombinase [Rhodococcus sp. BP-370]MBY6575452.1 DDE-type integrase/transposase/recombinase [Rhodococcus sp. BP-364]MBY6584753.1 DDE-type integrase/transposase/recombinase [Rhodococcus sp. BP-358]MBY6589090.1 DDE-type integrase/transposase/recombinase [Rhodococcus sp. BP-362]MBY6594377.1 DDE-type integ